MTGDFELARDSYRVIDFYYKTDYEFEMKVCVGHTKEKIDKYRKTKTDDTEG